MRSLIMFLVLVLTASSCLAQAATLSPPQAGGGKIAVVTEPPDNFTPNSVRLRARIANPDGVGQFYFLFGRGSVANPVMDEKVCAVNIPLRESYDFTVKDLQPGQMYHCQAVIDRGDGVLLRGEVHSFFVPLDLSKKPAPSLTIDPKVDVFESNGFIIMRCVAAQFDPTFDPRKEVRFLVELCGQRSELEPYDVGMGTAPDGTMKASVLARIVQPELPCRISVAVSARSVVSAPVQTSIPPRGQVLVPQSSVDERLSVATQEEILRDGIRRMNKFTDELHARPVGPGMPRVMTTEDHERYQRLDALCRAEDIRFTELYPRVPVPVAMPPSVAVLYGRFMLAWVHVRAAAARR